MPILNFDEMNIKISVNDRYKAHLSGDKQHHETLKIHINLVYDYFMEIVKKNSIEKPLNNLFEKSIALLDDNIDEPDAFGGFVKYLFAKAIYWHDMGKINPNFQVQKMQNKAFSQTNLSESYNHSPLSAYLFINCSIEELYNKNWDDEQIEIVEAITYLFGYIISKHHGRLHKNDEFDFKDDLKQFLKELQINDEYTKIHKAENRVFSAIYAYINKDIETLFLLSKTLFSTLIISDYYATAQFMNYGNVDGLKYNNFGLIDERFRQKACGEFYIDKFDKNGKQITFNQALKDKTNSDFKGFEELQSKSNENLNHLRGKLLVEVRTTLQDTLKKNISQNLFYIEAPTGAGKTNLSLMSAIEILKLDDSIKKIFYVFPFTTLITQTYDAIKKALALNNNQIVQLHSKAPYNQKLEEANDGVYGDNKTNFLDNQFMNYPVTLLSHVKFFDILTGTDKDDNYIFHRLANSIAIIDEIQTYNPDLWSKIVYLLDVTSKNFNIKFIVMSATLPKIGEILSDIKDPFVKLVGNKHKYFQNPNFANRVTIDQSVIKIKEEKDIYGKLLEESKIYQKLENNKTKKVKTIIEFITKKGADKFCKHAKEQNTKDKFFDEILILSGTIIEPRRKEIINILKNTNDKNILLVTTQVVEAGVDIDMDVGFKERSLVDSDEQLAGRINRNSAKENCKLFLFEMEQPNAKAVYKKDKRLGITTEENVLERKDFDEYYKQVIAKLKTNNNTSFIDNLNTYKDHIKNLRFNAAHIKIIEMESISVFVPITTMAQLYWNAYEKALQNKEQDLIDKKINIKKLSAKISKYTFSLAKYQGSGIEYLKPYCKEKYGYWYFEEYQNIYSYEDGLDTSVLKGENVGMYI